MSQKSKEIRITCPTLKPSNRKTKQQMPVFQSRASGTSKPIIKTGEHNKTIKKKEKSRKMRNGVLGFVKTN